MATEQNVIPLARESVKEDTLQSRDSGKDGGDNTTDEEGRGDTKEATNVASTTAAAQSKSHQKKIGHRRVDETGQTTYKKTPSSALSGSIQLGISHTVAKLSSKPERDVLMQDFQVVETILFPSGGSNITPAHHFGDFTFRTYAPTAFRYFRDLFGIQPDDYMLSISRHPLVELSNPGASGSLFFVTHDDEFIIKTVLHKEAEFLQKLLPGYYMNLVQNPRTLLPKFYGLYNVQAGGKNIRVVVMNNLLPRRIEMHLKFDLKGSTFKRKASKQERSKKHPTFKDLDLLQDFPDGALLSSDIHNVFIKTLQRDCLVLQSFKIMDYSMLLAIHNIDQAERDVKSKGNGAAETCLTSTILTKDHPPQPRRSQLSNQTHSRDSSIDYASDDATGASLIGVRGNHSVMASTMLRSKYTAELDHWSGGIPAKNSRGEKLLLFCGIIDILQCYKFRKKLEHTWKSMIADGDTISVHRPKFYCERFQKFMADNVFRKDSSIVRSQPSRRVSRHSRRAVSKGDVQAAASSSSGQMRGRPDLLPTESPRPLSSGSSDESKGRGSSPRRMMSPHDRPERRSSNSAVMIAKGSKSEVVETTFSAISSIASRRSSTGSRTNSPTGSRQGSTLSRQASTASRKESPASSRKDSPSRKAIVNRPQVLESDVQHSPSKDRSATVSPATPNGQPSSPNRAATWSPNGASLHVDQVGVAVGGEMKEGTATTMTGGDSRDDSSSSDGDYVVVPGNPRRGRVTAL